MSGRGDSNSRPLRPERSALTGLRYAPKYLLIKNKLLLVELQSLTLKIGRLLQLSLLILRDQYYDSERMNSPISFAFINHKLFLIFK